jgi:hypothetical protein
VEKLLLSRLYRCWRRRRARWRRSSAFWIVFSELLFSCLCRCWRRRRARWRRSSAFWIAFSELHFLACTGVGGGEEQDGGDHLHFGLSSLSYIFLPVQVLEEEKSKMEEIICKKDDKLRELGPHLAKIVDASK